MAVKKISTTQLAKAKAISTGAMFELLTSMGYLVNNGDKPEITEAGKAVGGEMVDSKRYGTYPAWPEDMKLGKAPSGIEKQPLITATAIGEHFELSASRVNHILAELGWIKKGLKGWVLTSHGEKLGGIQSEARTSGIPYVRWPEKIVQIKALLESVSQSTGADTVSVEPESAETTSFREKFPATHRATDGHMVRSKSEMLIDNWLYVAEIVHAYERKLPIEEEVYCDFYLPSGKVYIEYWGYEDDPKYIARKKVKQGIYQKYGFNLIELSDKDVLNLDDVLPRLLLKHGIESY